MLPENTNTPVNHIWNAHVVRLSSKTLNLAIHSTQKIATKN